MDSVSDGQTQAQTDRLGNEFVQIFFCLVFNGTFDWFVLWLQMNQIVIGFWSPNMTESNWGQFPLFCVSVRRAKSFECQCNAVAALRQIYSNWKVLNENACARKFHLILTFLRRLRIHRIYQATRSMANKHEPDTRMQLMHTVHTQTHRECIEFSLLLRIYYFRFFRLLSCIRSSPQRFTAQTQRARNSRMDECSKRPDRASNDADTGTAN